MFLLSPAAHCSDVPCLLLASAFKKDNAALSVVGDKVDITVG